MKKGSKQWYKKAFKIINHNIALAYLYQSQLFYDVLEFKLENLERRDINFKRKTY